MVNLRPVVEWSSFANLDCFIRKNIFFCIKQFRLAGPFEKQPKLSGFGMLTKVTI
jgi:hypothetical protein